MKQILIKISNDNGSTWSDVLTPSSYKISAEDLDNDSYRSVVNGNLIRNRISRGWIKLELNYNFVSDTDIATLATQINSNQEYKVRIFCPAYNSTWTEFTAYTSNWSAEMLEKQLGWVVEFSIIQSKLGSWQ